MAWTPTSGIDEYPTLTAVPAQSTVTNATAATRDLDQNELISNQVKGLIQQDSPLMQQAATLAKQSANKSGLLNSSMAIQAGQNAVIGQALPMAQHQANAVTNVLDKNQANQQTTNTFNADSANKNSIVNASEQNKVLSQMMDSQTKMQLADIEANYKTLMQADASAMQIYQNSVRNISDILMNPDLSAEAKTAAVNNQNALLKTGMQLIGKMNNLNLDDLLVFPSA